MVLGQRKKEKPRNGFLEYRRIRRYLSKIYLYGFFKNHHFRQMNDGSAKNYSSVMRLIGGLTDSDQKRDTRKIRRQYHYDNSRALTDSYMYHAIDVQTDMAEYLHILDALAAGSMPFPEIDKQLAMVLSQPPSVATVRNRLKTLVDYGVVCCANRQYALVADGLDGLRDDQLMQLYCYVCFCACTTYPRVAGSFLQRTLERHLHKRKLSVPRQQVLLRHNSHHNVFDEELIYQLLRHMAQPGWVLFDDRKRLPVEIRADVRLGRWYVLCVDDQFVPCIEKITNVEKLIKNAAVSDRQWEKACSAVREAFAYVLCSGNMSAPVLVSALLQFDGAEALRRQFVREIRRGQLVQRDGQFYYEVWVSDPRELKPFLRSYANYLRILPGEHSLEEQIHGDLQQMLDALDGEVAV